MDRRTLCVLALATLLLMFGVRTTFAQAKEEACSGAKCGTGEKCEAMFSCSPKPCKGNYIPSCIPDYSYPICNLPSRTGRCYASFSRFYYNRAKGECLSFTYGGCDGNGNRFDSKEDCEKRCPHQ